MPCLFPRVRTFVHLYFVRHLFLRARAQGCLWSSHCGPWTVVWAPRARAQGRARLALQILVSTAAATGADSAASHARPRNEVVDLDSGLDSRSVLLSGPWGLVVGFRRRGLLWCAEKIDRPCVCSRNPRPKPTKCRSSEVGLEAQCGGRLLTQPSSLLRRGPHIHRSIAPFV